MRKGTKGRQAEWSGHREQHLERSGRGREGGADGGNHQHLSERASLARRELASCMSGASDEALTQKPNISEAGRGLLC